MGFCNFSSFARIFYCYPTFFAKTVNSVNSRAFSYLQMSFSLEHHFHAFVISRFFFFFSIKSKSRDFFLVEVEHHFHKDFFLVSQFLMLSSLFEKSVNSRIFFCVYWFLFSIPIQLECDYAESLSTSNMVSLFLFGKVGVEVIISQKRHFFNFK